MKIFRNEDTAESVISAARAMDAFVNEAPEEST
jgi:hypothetical protein